MNFDCRDIVIYDDDGVAVYSGPRFFRCSRGGCELLMTHKMIHDNFMCPGRLPGITCANRRWKPALEVTEEEQAQIIDGKKPTYDWEYNLITESIKMIEVQKRVKK